MKSALRIVCPILVVALMGLAWWSFSNRVPSSALKTQQQPSARSSPIVSTDPYRWGHAVHSAAKDGTGFFDRARRESFIAKSAPTDRPYIIELNSRAFLPDAGLTAAEALLDGELTTPVTAYLQFTHHRDEEHRESLLASGVELLTYASGRAWIARATPAAFRALLRSGEARALATIDARDKLAPAVYAQRVPAYAKLEDGRAVYSAILRKGSGEAALKAHLENSEFTAQNASVLGERYRVLLAPENVEKLAALSDVAFVGYGPPPVASRDAKLDESSNVKDIRDGALGLTGTGVKVAVREIGRVLVHQDLQDQLDLVDNTGESLASEVRHASAVSGVVVGKGVASPRRRA